MDEQQQSLEPIAEPNGRNQFLELIEQVIKNPEVSVEKVKALLEMQLQIEDRQSKREFDAAMIEAQAEVQALKWDKFNASNQSRNVSYPKIEAMVKPVREKHGFSQSFDTEPAGSLDQMIMCCDVAHRGGHTRRYRLPMPIDGSGPKGGGVMTKPQAVGNGTSYGMRYLDKMIWNIPMLVDKDDNDGNTTVETVTEEQAVNLRAMCEEIDKEQEQRLCKYYSQQCKCEIKSLEHLPKMKYQDALKGLTKKIREGI